MSLPATHKIRLMCAHCGIQNGAQLDEYPTGTLTARVRYYSSPQGYVYPLCNTADYCHLTCDASTVCTADYCVIDLYPTRLADGTVLPPRYQGPVA